MESNKIKIFPELFEISTVNFSRALNYDKIVREISKLSSPKISFKETKQILKKIFENVETSQTRTIFHILTCILDQDNKEEPSNIESWIIDKNLLQIFFFLQLFKNRKEKMQNLNQTWDFGRMVNESMAGRDSSFNRSNNSKQGNVNAKLNSFLQNNYGKNLIIKMS